ncbi:MAG TPA: hypothetical protein VHB18_01590 [Mycobacteriales bacterium]|jgi:YD repeat-containing protein|nr:hypothetical protein [Mycobacteriales bacterium]
MTTPRTYTYDKEGHLLTGTNKNTHKVTSYTWNSAHQLFAVTAPAASQT